MENNRESGTRYTGTIGLIGVGTMGQVLLKRLIDNGIKVLAADVSEAARQKAVEIGAELAEKPAEVAQRAKFIIMSLPAPAHINSVVFGPGGLIETVTQGHIVVDTSTVDPETTRAAHAACAEKGAEYLDAPVLGRPASIGNWVLPVGGSEEALRQVEDILAIFAKRTVHVGPSGSGNTLKLINQLMFSVINAVTAEAFAVAEKAGLDARIFYDAVETSGAATVSGLFTECGKKIVGNDYDPVFPVKLLCKDAGLAIEMARKLGVPPVIASNVQIYNEIARDTGYSDWDTSALVRVFD
ncbi:MAG: NAD(P)-dependent oxidoreductase [Bacteroidetes bacterium]|nr:NAD(P)-dependent oxidoreductase [Bacteroidota bacterium]